MRPINKDRLHSAVNKYIEINDNLHPRVEHELPGLLMDAQALIDALRKEYAK